MVELLYNAMPISAVQQRDERYAFFFTFVSSLVCLRGGFRDSSGAARPGKRPCKSREPLTTRRPEMRWAEGRGQRPRWVSWGIRWGGQGTGGQAGLVEERAGGSFKNRQDCVQRREGREAGTRRTQPRLERAGRGESPGGPLSPAGGCDGAQGGWAGGSSAPEDTFALVEEDRSPPTWQKGPAWHGRL